MSCQGRLLLSPTAQVTLFLNTGEPALVVQTGGVNHEILIEQSGRRQSLCSVIVAWNRLLNSTALTGREDIGLFTWGSERKPGVPEAGGAVGSGEARQVTSPCPGLLDVGYAGETGCIS